MATYKSAAATMREGAFSSMLPGCTMFQVGCIGLMKSIDHFNTELGVRFSTYAVPMNVIWGNPPKNTIWTARPEKKEKIYAILQH